MVCADVDSARWINTFQVLPCVHAHKFSPGGNDWSAVISSEDSPNCQVVDILCKCFYFKEITNSIACTYKWHRFILLELQIVLFYTISISISAILTKSMSSFPRQSLWFYFHLRVTKPVDQCLYISAAVFHDGLSHEWLGPRPNCRRQNVPIGVLPNSASHERHLRMRKWEKEWENECNATSQLSVTHCAFIIHSLPYYSFVTP